MSATPSVVFQSSARPYAVVVAPQPSRRGRRSAIVVLALLAAVVVAGLAFIQWIERTAAVAGTPASCVDGGATSAADYRARTEAIVNLADGTEVAGVAICR